MSFQRYRIGRVSREAGVPVDTIRYYEKRGLIAAAPRTSSGYRLFGAETVRRLRFIRHAQALGFTLEEIGKLLALEVGPRSRCDEVRARAEERLAEIERKLAHLAGLRTALRRLVAACVSREPTAACPILEALHEEDDDATTH